MMVTLVKYLAPQAIIYFCLTIILSLYIAPYTKSLSKEMLSVNSFEEQIESIKSNDLVTFDNGGFIYVKDAENNEIKGIKLLQFDKDNSYIVIADELIVDKNNDLDLNFLNDCLKNDNSVHITFINIADASYTANNIYTLSISYKTNYSKTND